MTVEELIEALEKLPKEAHRKEIIIHLDDGVELEIGFADYDLSKVMLRS